MRENGSLAKTDRKDRKMVQARLTTHCSQRLKERMSLIQEELCRILNDDLVVLVGQESGTHRIHKLFYSIYDKTYYVAVQDEETGGVITILPPEQSRWRIAPDAYSQAKALICGEKKVPAEVALVSQSKHDGLKPQPSIVKFTVYLKRGRKIVRFKVGDYDILKRLFDFDCDPKERIALIGKLLFENVAHNRDWLINASVYYQLGCSESSSRIPYPID